MMNTLKKMNPETVGKMIVILALVVALTLSVGVTTRGGNQPASSAEAVVVVD